MIPVFDLSNDKTASEASEKAMFLPIGAASPLWLMFAGAATAGMAFWWATRWRTATHLEAVLPLPEPLHDAAPLGVEVAPPAVAELASEVLEAPEPVMEAAPEPAAEPIASAPDPVAPQIEVEAAPTPKTAAARRSPRKTTSPRA